MTHPSEQELLINSNPKFPIDLPEAISRSDSHSGKPLEHLKAGFNFKRDSPGSVRHDFEIQPNISTFTQSPPTGHILTKCMPRTSCFSSLASMQPAAAEEAELHIGQTQGPAGSLKGSRAANADLSTVTHRDAPMSVTRASDIWT